MNSSVVKEYFGIPSLKADGKNFVASCKHCIGVQISGNVSSSSNFIKHLKVGFLIFIQMEIPYLDLFVTTSPKFVTAKLLTLK